MGRDSFTCRTKTQAGGVWKRQAGEKDGGVGQESLKGLNYRDGRLDNYEVKGSLLRVFGPIEWRENCESSAPRFFPDNI